MKFRSLNQTTITSEPSDIPEWKVRLAPHIIADGRLSDLDHALDRLLDPDLGIACDAAIDDVRNCFRDFKRTLQGWSQAHDPNDPLAFAQQRRAAIDRAVDRAFDRAIDCAARRARPRSGVPNPAPAPAPASAIDRALDRALALTRTFASALECAIIADVHASLEYQVRRMRLEAACLDARGKARTEACARGLKPDPDSYCRDPCLYLQFDHHLQRDLHHIIDRLRTLYSKCAIACPPDHESRFDRDWSDDPSLRYSSSFALNFRPRNARFGRNSDEDYNAQYPDYLALSLAFNADSHPDDLEYCTVRSAFERLIKRAFDGVIENAFVSFGDSDGTDCYQVAIKHAHGTEEVFVAKQDPSGRMQTVKCNTFLQMDSGKGGKKTEIIVCRGNEIKILAQVKIRENKSLYRIPLDPKHRLVLTLQLGKEMSAPEVADACFEDAKAAINQVADNDPESLEKLQKATARLRYVTDLGVNLANDNINPFAEAGLQVAQLALQKLVELNVHSNSTLNQDVLECIQRINSRKVLWTKSKPPGLRKALSSAMSQALDVLETILQRRPSPSPYTDQPRMPCDIQKKRVFLEQCSEAIDKACFAGHDRNICGRKQTAEKLLSRFMEALRLLLEELLFNCPLNGDYRVVIKYVNGTEDIVLDSRGGAVSANKRKVFLPVNVVGMTVALHFYTRRAGFGEKTVAFFETQLIVPGDNHLIHEIRFARCDATLQLSLGEELSAAEVVNVRQRQASEALAAASGGMDKVAQCTRDLRFFVDLAVAGSEINPFAKAGFALAKVGFDTLNEASGAHDAFTKLSDQCDEYIDIINDIGEVFTSRRVQAETRKALIAVIGALERISCHYEQTWIKRLTRSSVKEAEDLSRDLKDRLSTMVSLAALTEIRANQIKC